MTKTTLRQAVYAAPHLDVDDVVVVLDGELVAQGKISAIASDEMRDALATPNAQIYLHPDAAADFARWIREQGNASSTTMRLH